MAGGKVTVNSTGTIGVGGDGGAAINLQSIGGGGGTINLHGTLIAPISGAPTDALNAVSLASAPAGATPAGFNIALGSVNGTGNAGGDIDGAQQGQAITEGDNSLGLAIQSIGGGGGRAIAHLEADDISLIGLSTVVLGGTDQVDSGGGDISYVQDGTLVSLGDFSATAVIQSIGGGGGLSQVVVGGTPAAPALSPTAQLLSPTVVPLLVPLPLTLTTVTLGSVGGTGNDGGSIDTSFTGGFESAGDHSPTLVQQSIGAGGGFELVSGDDAPQITLGGSAGAQGNGGDITSSTTARS